MAAPATPSLYGIPLEYVIFGAVLLCIACVAPFLVSLGSPEAKMRARIKRLEKRVKHKSTHKDGTETTASLRRQEGDTSLPLLTRLLSHLPNISVMRDRLDRSGMAVSVERYFAVNILIFIIVVGVFTLVLDKGALLSCLIGIVIGLGVPNFVVNFRIARTNKKFLTLFPDAIDLIVRGLRAGLPVAESIKMVAREIDDPVGTIFRTMTEKMALGIPLEKTLYDTATKYRITEFDFFVTSIALQRETGGNLSEILNNLSEALRQRLMMRLKIKAMSSEAKASMYIIAALPFMVLGALAFASPEYLSPLIDDFRGNVALAIAGGMLSTGVFIMTRMTKFEI